MKQLRKRFILFNMLVISCVIIVIALFFEFSGRSILSINRISAILIGMVFVFIASLILSKAAIAPIKAAWKKQIDFSADASHELRTPLSVIQSNLDVVLSNPAESVESQMKWLKNIEIENKRMSILVADLLLLSRADSDEAIININDFDLSSLIAETITAYNIAAKQKDISVNASIENGIFFRGDADRTKQLFIILLDNAIKYTDAGGKIDIAISIGKNKIYLKISDTGIGIEQDEIDKIFHRFFRGKGSRQKNPDGCGMGLAIANLIAKEHGGNIAVNNQVGEGSCFTVSLPYNSAAKMA